MGSDLDALEAAGRTRGGAMPLDAARLSEQSFEQAKLAAGPLVHGGMGRLPELAGQSENPGGQVSMTAPVSLVRSLFPPSVVCARPWTARPRSPIPTDT